MSELGKMLRVAREAKGLSYQTVAKTTKIREHILIALEDETYDMLPAPVYVRGLLRTLARHLSLDADTLLRQYESAVPQGKTIPPADPPAKSRLPVVSYLATAESTHANGSSRTTTHASKPKWTLPASLRAERPATPLAQQVPAPPEPIAHNRALILHPNARALKPVVKQRAQQPSFKSFKSPMKLNWRLTSIAAILLITLGLCGAYWDNLVQTQLGVAPAPTLPATAPNFFVTATPTEIAPTMPASAPTPTPTLSSIPVPTATPMPTIPSAPNLTSLIVKLDIVDRTWVRIEVDSKDAFEGIFGVGETKTFTATKSVTMRAGNAGGVNVSVNGQPSVALGGNGDVVDRQWNISPLGAPVLATPTWVKPPFTPTPTVTLTLTATPKP